MNAYVPTFERAPILDALYPDSVAAGTVTGDWVDASEFHSFLLTVLSGVAFGTSVDAKIEQATDSSGTGAKDVTNAAITQITAASRAAALSFNHNNLDMANDFRWVRISLTVVGTDTECAATLHGMDARFDPAPVEANATEVAAL